MAETKTADIFINGIHGKDEVFIGVYPHDVSGYFYEGEIESKELAERIGADIAGYINSGDNGQLMFSDRSFGAYFESLEISDIRTNEEPEDFDGKLPDTKEPPVKPGKSEKPSLLATLEKNEQKSREQFGGAKSEPGKNTPKKTKGEEI